MNKAMGIGAVVVILVIIVVGAVVVLTGGMHSSSSTSSIGSTPVPTLSGTNTPSVTSSASTTVAATSTVMAENTSYTVELKNSSTLGLYLANGTGFTLYTYTNDVPNSGASACGSGCIGAWPAFYTATLVLAPGLNASSFNTITRSGGAMQLTYKGWPLYLFVGDHQAGQISGNGVNGFKLATK
jgi:predicted lipoprotein with Yx(FWY)xxD motif